MSYKRKTHSDEELSAACRRASLSRVNRRGGRPRSDPSGRPPKSLKVSARHYEVLAKIASAYRRTIKDVAETLIKTYVNGTTVPIQPHPQFVPDDRQSDIAADK